jgi:hypothetical protein
MLSGKCVAQNFQQHTLVENMEKKNNSRFPIAVLLTILIHSHQTTVDLYFWFYDCNFEILGAYNTPLERYFQYHSSGILKAPKFLKNYS